MIRYVSLTWNALFIVMALLTPVLMYQSLLVSEQIIPQDILRELYGGSFSDGERTFGVLFSTSIVWLVLLAIWGIGALILWPFKSAARRKSATSFPPIDQRRRREPKL